MTLVWRSGDGGEGCTRRNQRGIVRGHVDLVVAFEAVLEIDDVGVL